MVILMTFCFMPGSVFAAVDGQPNDPAQSVQSDEDITDIEEDEDTDVIDDSDVVSNEDETTAESDEIDNDTLTEAAE